LKHNLRLGFFKIFVCHCSMSPDESLEQGRNRRDSSLTLTISHYAVIKTMFMYFFVYGSLGREDGCRCDRNTYCNS